MTRQLVAALVVLALAALLLVLGALSERAAAHWDDVDEDADCPECGVNLAEGDWHESGCPVGMEAAQDLANEAAFEAARDERFDR